MLTGNGLQAGCQAVEQGAGLAAGDRKRASGPLCLGRTQQVDLQICCFESDELFGRLIQEHVTSMAAVTQIVKSAFHPVRIDGKSRESPLGSPGG